MISELRMPAELLRKVVVVAFTMSLIIASTIGRVSRWRAKTFRGGLSLCRGEVLMMVKGVTKAGE